jgi:hypothetical protein
MASALYFKITDYLLRLMKIVYSNLYSTIEDVQYVCHEIFPRWLRIALSLLYGKNHVSLQ